ncbi:MAG: ABC transporter ATP-binding protein [Candidatus Doudnabacteria bacterium]|nr:ABC transporter ATP-binding protein [Candidatus Doudnabacteria bacterium]
MILLLVASMVAATAVDVYIPSLYKQLFNGLAMGAATGQLLSIIYTILGSAFVMWAFWRVAGFTNDFFQPRVMADILDTCFKYLHDHSYNFFSSNFVGSLVKRVTRFERAFESVADIIYWEMGQTALRIVIILFVLYFYVHEVLALLLLAWSVLYVIFSYIFARFKLKYDIENSEIDTKVSGTLADTITNNINIKLFGGTAREFKTFRNVTQKQFQIRKWTWNLSDINEAVQGGLMVFLEFLMLYNAVKYWQRGVLTIGDFALIQAFLVQIFGRLWNLGRHIKQLYERLAEAEEMTEILMTPHEVHDKPDAKKLEVPLGKIEFKNLTFGYHKSRNVFKNFNLVIKPGERIAFIGPSGGGKTTIVKLLFRFFDVSGGEILIDGQNLADVTQESLRANLSLVPQDPILFHRSLYDNIAYGRSNASSAEIYKAARQAHCHEFISSFPKGYDTFVGERGIKLSGGERQRVAIARAILKNAPILVLDEATSSLDSESEYFIQDALKTLMKNKTTIVIAHRLSTIMQMDRIVVIDKGQIMEEGKHAELVKAKQGIYQKLWEIQAGGFGSA